MLYLSWICYCPPHIAVLSSSLSVTALKHKYGVSVKYFHSLLYTEFYTDSFIACLFINLIIKRWGLLPLEILTKWGHISAFVFLPNRQFMYWLFFTKKVAQTQELLYLIQINVVVCLDFHYTKYLLCLVVFTYCGNCKVLQ